MRRPAIRDLSSASNLARFQPEFSVHSYLAGGRDRNSPPFRAVGRLARLASYDLPPCGSRLTKALPDSLGESGAAMVSQPSASRVAVFKQTVWKVGLSGFRRCI